jgi:hypothetical protein
MKLILLTYLFYSTFTFALPDFPPWEDAHLIRRAAPSDPCCKSCGPIGKALVDCPRNTTDIFCVCEPWVKTAPTCQACISNVNFNTSFAINPGPAIEIFWAMCQCKDKCKKVAEAVFGPKPCNYGTDELCVVKTLVEDGPDCECCIREVDEWFASYFKIFVEQAADFLKTFKSAVPGMIAFHCH